MDRLTQGDADNGYMPRWGRLGVPEDRARPLKARNLVAQCPASSPTPVLLVTV